MPIPIRSGPYKTFHRLKSNESYLEFEGSTITIPIKGRVTENSPWMEDEISLKAFMRLEVFPSYVNGLGTREFQFVIRDWELWGTCELLNKLFYAHPAGREISVSGLKKEKKCPGERLPAVLTFTVSHNYFKEGDAHDEILGPVDSLDIRNLTSVDLRTFEDAENGHLRSGIPGNTIYWQVRVHKEKADVVFFRRPLGNDDQIPTIDVEKDHESILCAVEVPVRNGRSEFRAAIDLECHRRNSNVAKAAGNTIISPLLKPRTPIEVRWRLGDKPRDGNGRIRIVSPSRSLCTSDQGPDVGMPFDSADFPARITYAVNYHIFINKERFVEDQAGIAIAIGAKEIPPRDVTVAFDKPHVGRVLGRLLEFGPGHCTGMHTITESEYQLGAATARYWRTVPLAASGGWPEPFDLNNLQSY